MERVRVPRVKICCISSVEEARLAIQYGASALGLVAEMPSGPGVIGEELITEIAATVPPGVASFLLTSYQNAPAIIEQQRRCRVNTIQLCDRLDFDQYELLRYALPGIALVQVVHVGSEEAIDEAVGVAPYVDAILLDSGNQSLAIKELGGTGRRHDWAISRQIRDAIQVPLYLAGGLKPDNVQEAVEAVGPFGLDICSGLRTEGALDENKVRDFFRELSNPI